MGPAQKCPQPAAVTWEPNHFPTRDAVTTFTTRRRSPLRAGPFNLPSCSASAAVLWSNRRLRSLPMQLGLPLEASHVPRGPSPRQDHQRHVAERCIYLAARCYTVVQIALLFPPSHSPCLPHRTHAA